MKKESSLTADDLRRVVVENVSPQIDAGRFPIKRCPGEGVFVQATIHADGADMLAAVLRYRPKDGEWSESSMKLVNAGLDLWEGRFRAGPVGFHEYTIEAWVDVFSTWLSKLKKKSDAGQNVEQDLQEGAALIQKAGACAKGSDAEALRRKSDQLKKPGDLKDRATAALAEDLSALMARYGGRDHSTTHPPLALHVERERARTGAWYEMFPRSAGRTADRSATFREAEDRLEDIARMGFDVVYLPPIHPIGTSFRKGPNNALTARTGDPGSAWAIGSPEGGHKAVHPDLGTLSDFDRFVKTVGKMGMEIAMDIAYQCSPDHPYVREHPEWFHHRPDGTIQYAENPPKKYEDIYPLNFECEQWQALWQELKDVVVFWAKRGVAIFRVDNPHTKPYRFWEWMIREVQSEFPKTVFLAEAFTRPDVMQYLAKCGFSQSYTYFTWRNTKQELTEYLTELTQTPVREYLRPNFFANTPDILHAFLQTGGRAAFQIRFILAATLAASYGIYGPPFELCERRAFPGTEDYVDSEKYQIRVWDIDRPGNIRPLITQVNRIRKENPALQLNTNLQFFPVDNPNLLFYGKMTEDGSNKILIVVNLDPKGVQAGWVKVPRAEWNLPNDYVMHDLLTDNHYQWRGDSNYVKLDPNDAPAHIFRVNHETA